MRKLRTILAGVFAAGLLAAPVVAEEDAAMPNMKWSFDKIFGTYDLAAAQRGFLVYSNVCSNCHSMTLMHYRDLSGIGLNADQIKAVAANVTVPQASMTRAHQKRAPRHRPASSSRRSPTIRRPARPMAARCHPTCR